MNRHFIDPLKFAASLWPDVTFYREQKIVIYSVVDNDETFVTAGHQLGKDFVTAFIVLWYFLCHHPVRIVTTSADSAQLESVLWGEIRRFIGMSRYDLSSERGGPLVINHLHLRKMLDGVMCPVSYCIGRVAAKGEGMAGHHAPYSLYVGDEGSGLENISYERADTWAKRKLIIGNPYSTGNFFEKGVKGGDIYVKG